jgi:hypothetical protein
MNRKVIRNMLSKVDESYRLELLYRAVDRLPEEQLVEVFGALMRYCDQDELAGPTPDVFEDVSEFVGESERGAYYDDPDSLPYGKHSDGTNRWIAECCRLLGLLVESSAEDPTQKVAEAFDSIFELLRQINRGDDTIVFFADEGGAWQVGVEWKSVVPAWSQCLATFETPEACATRTLKLIGEFAAYERDKLMKSATKVLPDEHARALTQATEEKWRD